MKNMRGNQLAALFDNLKSTYDVIFLSVINFAGIDLPGVFDVDKMLYTNYQNVKTPVT